VCLAFLLLVVVASIAAPLIAPYGPIETDLAHVLSTPTPQHLLGTDSLGRDVLSRLLFGSRLSLEGVLIATGTFLLVGVPLGLLAGFYGGWFDRVASWLIDLALTVPAIVILLVVLAILGNNSAIAMMALGLLAAPGLARLVRAITLAAREELYVSAARVSGLPDRHILAKHVLPRLFGPIIVRASLFAGEALIAEAGLEYLGLGAQPPTPTWGGMVSDAASAIDRQPWLLVPPGVMIGLTVIALALLGDALQESARPPAVRASRLRSLHAEVSATSLETSPQPTDQVRADRRLLLSMRGIRIEVPRPDGWVTVVTGVDLDVAPGETVGLVGESGCGKSVTARSVLQLPNGGQISAGRIEFDGEDITSLDGHQLRRLRGSQIALISQEPIGSLDPCRTVGQQLRELVQLHERIRGAAAARRVLELLEAVRLPEPQAVAGRYPHQLSGGMAQRVAIAMALSGRPRLLVADEPTTALDVTVQAEILALLRELQAQTGMAVLLITHDWGVVADTCSRAYVMYAGQIVEQSDIDTIFREPRHPYTAGLLNSAPSRAVKGRELTPIEGAVPDPTQWPTGCRFAPRCPYATTECTQRPIALLEAGPKHAARCIHQSALVEERTRDVNERVAAYR
jgi:peptide/nickel transport system permease protein